MFTSKGSNRFFVRIPEGVQAERTGVQERAISINVLGTDVVARTDFKLRGSSHQTCGYVVWVYWKGSCPWLRVGCEYGV